MAKKPIYDDSTMRVHSDLENVRENPETYLGSATIEGCRHTFLEILANSLDEVKNGYGSSVEVKLYKDGSISVRDHGRGIPLAYNKSEKKDNWEIAYTILGGGGKFSNGADGVYQQGTLGVHGIGAAATQLSSDWFIVDSYRDGKHYHVDFKDGEPVKGKNGKVLQSSKNKNNETGTFQWWKPSDQVFIDTNIDAEYIRSVLHEQAIVTKEATLIFDDENTGEHVEYHYDNGIQDYMLEETDDGKDLLVDPIYIEASGTANDKDGHTGKFSEPYDVMAQICIGFSNKTQFLQYFHNSSNLIYGGSPDKALKKGLLQVVDDEIKTLGKYKARESKIKWADIEEVLCYISSSFSGRTIFEGQTKFAINSPGVELFISETIKTKLSTWLTENRPSAEKICDLVLANKRARESAETIRTATKKKLTSNLDITNRVENFVDCRSKDPNEREIFIVEGASALGSVKQGRNAAFQAIMPIRGKILNCCKASFKSILDSTIITDLIRVLGCGIDIPAKYAGKKIARFDINNLNFSKVIIMTDQDVDGFHIRCLVLTMIYRLCPELINQGKVFIGESPLYEITYGTGKNEKHEFAFSDGERDEILSRIGNVPVQIQRSKGLGENDPEMMAIFMNPATRKLIKVMPNSVEEMNKWFELFMGNKVDPRRNYIVENIDQYQDLIDLTSE